MLLTQVKDGKCGAVHTTSMADPTFRPMRSLTKRRTCPRWVGCVLLFAMLWTQLAVASYACPSLLKSAGTEAVAMIDCNGASMMPSHIDPDNPQLCLQHSLQGDQNADHGQGPTVPPMSVSMLPVALVYLSSQATCPRDLRFAQLTRSSSVPKSIAHCCFRI